MNDSSTSTQKCDKLPKCGICRSEIQNKAIHQPDPSLPIICSNCNENFTDDEVFLMTSLFGIYGGYFGQKKSTEFSFIDSIKSKYKGKFSKQDFEELNAQIYHIALVHGISLEECSQKLDIFLDSV